MAKERVHKVIALSGLMSRRAAERALSEGRIQVNGQTITEPGTSADPETDRITVDGQPLPTRTQNITLALHKPRLMVTTRSDPEGRPTVMELLPPEMRHLYPVGRLDFDTEGLLLMTNDGDLALKLTHPRYGIEKTYIADVAGDPTDEALQSLVSGITLEDGSGKFLEVIVLLTGPRTTRLEITVAEGRNRFVRRMFDAIQHPVQKLTRTRIGPIRLGTLRRGTARPLTPQELVELNAIVHQA